jgi:hypothetical protein
MTQPYGKGYGEYSSSSEYLREYGGLIVDLSNLLDTLQQSPALKDETHVFSIETIDEAPITVPNAVTEAVGIVKSADVMYSLDDNKPSLCIELFGDKKTYRINRYGSPERDGDTVLNLPHLDAVTLAMISTDDKLPKAYSDEPSDDFEKRISEAPSLSNADVARILFALSQPGMFNENDTILQNDQFNKIDLFDDQTITAFSGSLAAGAISEVHFTDYRLLADENAILSYVQENGQTAMFDFECVEPSGKTIRVRGSLAHGADLSFPQHAVATGHGQDSIDTVLSFPPTLAEIKYMREIITQETASLPEQPEIEVSTFGTRYIVGGAKHVAALDEQAAVTRQAESFVSARFKEGLQRLIDDLEKDND